MSAIDTEPISIIYLIIELIKCELQWRKKYSEIFCLHNSANTTLKIIHKLKSCIQNLGK